MGEKTKGKILNVIEQSRYVLYRGMLFKSKFVTI